MGRSIVGDEPTATGCGGLLGRGRGIHARPRVSTRRSKRVCGYPRSYPRLSGLRESPEGRGWGVDGVWMGSWTPLTCAWIGWIPSHNNSDFTHAQRHVMELSPWLHRRRVSVAHAGARARGLAHASVNKARRVNLDRRCSDSTLPRMMWDPKVVRSLPPGQVFRFPTANRGYADERVPLGGRVRGCRQLKRQPQSQHHHAVCTKEPQHQMRQLEAQPAHRNCPTPS